MMSPWVISHVTMKWIFQCFRNYFCLHHHDWHDRWVRQSVSDAVVYCA